MLDWVKEGLVPVKERTVHDLFHGVDVNGKGTPDRWNEKGRPAIAKGARKNGMKCQIIRRSSCKGQAQ